MSWLLFAFLNVLFNGTAIFLIKSAIKETKMGYSGVMFVSLFYGVLAYLPIFICDFISHPVLFSNVVGIYYFIIAVSITITAFFLYVHALAINDLSVFGPLDSLRPLFVVIFSIIFLHQSPTGFLLFGVMFIIAGTLVLTLQKSFFKKIDNIKNTSFALAATATFALSSIFDKKTLFYIDAIKYAFFVIVAVCCAYGVIYLKKNGKIIFEHFCSKKLIFIGLMWAMGYITIMLALKLATPNQVIPIQMSRSLYLSLLGFFFLGEKGYFKKILAAVLMLLGVWLVMK